LLTIRDEVAYQRSLDQLNGLIDLVGTDEQHSLYSLDGAGNRLTPELQAYNWVDFVGSLVIPPGEGFRDF